MFSELRKSDRYITMAIKKDDESATAGRVKNVINFVIKMLLSYIFFDVFSFFIAHVNFARA